MSTNPSPDPQELGGVLSRINRFGSATEQMFSRLYRGIGHRARQAEDLNLSAREMQEQLQQRDAEIERLSGILAGLDEGIIMQDTEGRIVVVNTAARELLGSQKSFWETELGTLFNAHKDLVALDAELLPVGEPTRVQINGRILGAQLAAVADSQGGRIGTIMVLRDVTRDALADRLKDQFITAISHELRTPMAVIKGMSEVLINQPSGIKPNRRLLESLSRNVDVLDRMIVELLDMSELGTDAFVLRQDELNLEDLIWHVVRGMDPEIHHASHKVLVMMKALTALHVTGDDQRLRWALGHLIQNSVRYSEEGSRIYVTAENPDNVHVAIQVIDMGVGISEKDLPHIFDRFYRGEARTSGGKLLDPRGLGQGLFIARTVTEAHGGYLSVRSTQGEGSMFTMVLPLSAS